MVAPLLAAIAVGAQTMAPRPMKAGPPLVRTDKAGAQKHAGGIEILSDTQGVDFKSWLDNWRSMTEQTWHELIPKEVTSPMKQGEVAIHFKILPDGRLMDDSMGLESSTGEETMDQAAWDAIASSNYPPLPKEFHGPYFELRALFIYNVKPE
jgi:TonB family protein